jgi:hypothetical protein
VGLHRSKDVDMRSTRDSKSITAGKPNKFGKRSVAGEAA